MRLRTGLLLGLSLVASACGTPERKELNTAGQGAVPADPVVAQGHFYRAQQYLRRGLELGPDPETRRRAEKELSQSVARVGEDQELEDFGPTFVVTKLNVNATWTEDSILRRHITFKEGDSI